MILSMVLSLFMNYILIPTFLGLGKLKIKVCKGQIQSLARESKIAFH